MKTCGNMHHKVICMNFFTPKQNYFGASEKELRVFIPEMCFVKLGEEVEVQPHTFLNLALN
jgi:hypothetical protein